LIRSSGESVFQNFLSDQGLDFVTNTRKIIPPFELDIYIPGTNLAIEFNGLFWHSQKDKYYHLNKTLRCREFGIQLFHIFESEDVDLWKERILNFLNSKVNSEIIQDDLLGHIIIADNTWQWFDLPVLEIIEPQKRLYKNFEIWDCGYTIYGAS
jgi:hypothetical protein